MGSRFQKGINDLKTWCEQHGRMDLLMEWNYDKNDKKITGAAKIGAVCKGKRKQSGGYIWRYAADKGL